MQPGASFCTACGSGLAPGAAFCTRCGAAVTPPLSAPAFVQGSGYAGGPGPQAGINVAFAPAVLPQAPGNAIPEQILSKWTWGAFWGTPLWAFWQADTLHKVLGVVLFVLSFSTGVFWVAFLGYGIYLGFRGNRIAAANRRFASVEQFLAVQRAWSLWGFVAFVVEVMVFGVMIFFLLMLGVLAALI